MAPPVFDVDAWLGAMWADGDLEVRLPPRIITMLKLGHGPGDDKLWTVDDVPPNALPAEQLGRVRKKWISILESCALLAKADVMPIDKARVDDWVRAQFCLMASKDVISPEFQADMDAQGMSGPQDMYGFELSMLLGRAVAHSEIEGGAYGSPATNMVGGTKAKKSATNPAMYNMDQVIAKAEETGQSVALEDFIQTLAHRLATSSLMPFHVPAANRVLTWYQKAKANLASSMGFILYCKEVRARYSGRGLPMLELFDTELAFKANNMAVKMAETYKELALGRFQTTRSMADTSSWDSGSTLSVGPSASAVSGTGGPMMERMGNLMESMERFSVSIAGVCSRVDALEDALDESAGGKDKRPCWVCGSTEHRKADCPNKKKGSK